MFSLTWPAYMQIYWNKRMRLHKKSVQLPEDWFGTPTWPPLHCFGTPTWPPWRHVKTLYIRVLHKTRTPRINGTKSMFTAYSTQGQLKAAAYPGRGLLWWAYPSRGLPWTWKRSYKCTQTLFAACWSRERLLRMLRFQLYPRPSRPRDARCSGGKMCFVYIYTVENGG